MHSALAGPRWLSSDSRALFAAPCSGCTGAGAAGLSGYSWMFFASEMNSGSDGGCAEPELRMRLSAPYTWSCRKSFTASVHDSLGFGPNDSKNRAPNISPKRCQSLSAAAVCELFIARLPGFGSRVSTVQFQRK
jgi:hypothetical protein